MRYFRLLSNDSCYSHEEIKKLTPDDIRDYVFANWDKDDYYLAHDRLISLILDLGYDLKFVNDTIESNDRVTSVYHFVKKADKKILD